MKTCFTCGVKLTPKNRGRWSPKYWCQKCDKERIEHISRQLREIQASFIKEGEG